MKSKMMMPKKSAKGMPMAKGAGKVAPKAGATKKVMGMAKKGY
jgi:hypothetical protein